MSKSVEITSGLIKSLLAIRHSKDVFVDECKNGPTHGATNLLKLDAWAMSRSWANPITFGYEIKVSRSDFLGDNKWPQYLKYCSQFYFVAPSGVIKPGELPKRVGLVVPTKNGTKLLTKKKAPIRNVTIPEDLFRYVLMCRAKISKEAVENNREYWIEWLEGKTIDHELGNNVSKTLRREIESRVLKLQTENVSLKDKIAGLTEVEEFCKILKIHPSRWLSEHHVKSKVDEESARIPKKVKVAVERLAGCLGSLQQLIDEDMGQTLIESEGLAK